MLEYSSTEYLDPFIENQLNDYWMFFNILFFLLGELMNINVELFYLFNHAFQNPFFDYIMPVLTHFGGFKFLILVLIAIVLYAHLRNRKHLKKSFF